MAKKKLLNEAADKSLEWINDTRNASNTDNIDNTNNTGNTKNIKNKGNISNKEKEEDIWKRATFIVRKEYWDALKAKAYWDRLQIKEVLDKALEKYFANEKIKPVPGEEK